MKKHRRRDAEEGQSTVEYILILLIAVVVAMLVLRDLVQPAMKKFSDYISQVVESSLFDRANFHRYRH